MAAAQRWGPLRIARWGARWRVRWEGPLVEVRRWGPLGVGSPRLDGEANGRVQKLGEPAPVGGDDRKPHGHGFHMGAAPPAEPRTESGYIADAERTQSGYGADIERKKPHGHGFHLGAVGAAPHAARGQGADRERTQSGRRERTQSGGRERSRAEQSG